MLVTLYSFCFKNVPTDLKTETSSLISLPFFYGPVSFWLVAVELSSGISSHCGGIYRLAEAEGHPCRLSSSTYLLQQGHTELVNQDHVLTSFGPPSLVIKEVFPDVHMAPAVSICVDCPLSWHWTPLGKVCCFFFILHSFSSGISTQS